MVGQAVEGATFGLHGGGSFVLDHLVCVVLIAIPLAALESGAGNLMRRSPGDHVRRLHLGAASLWLFLMVCGLVLELLMGGVGACCRRSSKTPPEAAPRDGTNGPPPVRYGVSLSTPFARRAVAAASLGRLTVR